MERLWFPGPSDPACPFGSHGSIDTRTEELSLAQCPPQVAVLSASRLTVSGRHSSVVEEGATAVRSGREVTPHWAAQIDASLSETDSSAPPLQSTVSELVNAAPLSLHAALCSEHFLALLEPCCYTWTLIISCVLKNCLTVHG